MGDKKEIVLSKKGPISKIEKAGEHVIEHLIELARTTDLTHSGMAKRINEIYGIDISRQNVEIFFKGSAKLTQQYLDNKTSLASFRVKLTMDYKEQLVKDIKDLSEGISELKGEEGSLLEIDKKWKQIGDLIDKKGRLLLREAKLSGNLVENTGNTQIDKMQVNIVNQINEEKSEIMRKLKTFEPEKIIEKVVDAEIKDVTPNENKKPDN